ncbi:MAG: hypothetical protein Q8R34_01115 [bacterium]|nr:hypothetical protein [bacterium]
MNEIIQKELQEKLGQLLAESPLAEELKKTILDGMDKLPEYLIFDLLDALEKEKIELERIAEEIGAYLEQQDGDWLKLEEKQQEAANNIVDQELQKIEDEVGLEEARETL